MHIIENYRAFVEDVERIGVPISLSKWPNIKRNLLYRYYPGRFGEEEGKQELVGYTPSQVGRVFANVLRDARRYTE